MNKMFLALILMFVVLGKSADASMTDIETAIMQKNYDEAINLAIQELKSSKDPSQRIEIEYYLGLSQLRLGEYAQSRSAFQIVMAAADSQDLYDRAALGRLESLYAQGLYKAALKQGKELLHRSPESSLMSLIYLKMARTYLKLTQWKLAKEYLQKIIREFPQSVEAPVARNLLEEKEYFAVQVGSFKDKEKAYQLVDQINGLGQYAYIVQTTTIDGDLFYRVRVGRMASLSNAQTLEAQLSQLGYPTLIYP